MVKTGLNTGRAAFPRKAIADKRRSLGKLKVSCYNGAKQHKLLGHLIACSPIGAIVSTHAQITCWPRVKLYYRIACTLYTMLATSGALWLSRSTAAATSKSTITCSYSKRGPANIQPSNRAYTTCCSVLLHAELFRGVAPPFRG